MSLIVHIDLTLIQNAYARYGYCNTFYLDIVNVVSILVYILKCSCSHRLLVVFLHDLSITGLSSNSPTSTGKRLIEVLNITKNNHECSWYISN